MAIVITKQPVNAHAAEGDNVTFAVEATGAASYRWQYNPGSKWYDLTWTGADTASLTFQVTVTRMAWQFRCIIEDEEGNAFATNEVHVLTDALYLIQGGSLADIADAIREKTGQSGLLTPAEMAQAIAALLDSSDATAGAAQILSGYTAYAQGEKIEGAMPNRGAVNYSFTSASGKYTIPEGYHNGKGAVTANIANFGYFSRVKMVSVTTTESSAKSFTVSHGLGVRPTGFYIFCKTLSTTSVAYPMIVAEMSPYSEHSDTVVVVTGNSTVGEFNIRSIKNFTVNASQISLNFDGTTTYVTPATFYCLAYTI